MKKIDLNDKKGFIIIIAAAFIPVVMLLFYLNIRSTNSSYTRTIFDNAVKNAALDTARKYIIGKKVVDQKIYLERIAAVSFDNSMKGLVGIPNNIIPLKKSTVGYTLQHAPCFDTDQQPDITNTYWESTGRRHNELANTQLWESTGLDPDADKTVDAYSNGTNKGYILKRDASGSYEQKHIYYKSTTENKNKISVSQVTENDVKVEASVVINKKKYTKACTATAPKLNADIVIGFPVNTGALSTDNNRYGTAVWDSNYKKTPLWQIKTECRNLIKQLLGCRNCAIGLIPYCGNVVLPWTGYTTVSHGSYKYSNYSSVNPTVPIAESYKFRSGHRAIGFDLNHSATTNNSVTQIMYRSELEEHLQAYMRNGATKTTAIESIIYDAVDNNTKFMFNAVDIIYGGSANIMAGYSKIGTRTYHIPYPMRGLTQKPLDMYRYLALVAPFRDQFQRSSFIYLPVMFGMSMLKNGFLKDNSYPTPDNNRKKVLILITNQADLWQSKELTYFGYANDASYIPMVDGDRIDYEKGTLEDPENGYKRSKIFTSSDVVYGTGNFGTTSSVPGIFLDAYDKAVAIKSDYIKDSTDGSCNIKLPKPGNVKMVVKGGEGGPCMILFTKNIPYCKDNIVTGVSGHNGGTVVNDDGVYYCYAANDDAYFWVNVSKSDVSPVYAMAELQGVEIDTGSTGMDVRQDSDYIYFCSNHNNVGSFKVKLKRITDSSQMIQHDTLAYFDKNLLTDSSKNLTTPSTINVGINTTEVKGSAYNVDIDVYINYKSPDLSVTVDTPPNKTTETAFSYMFHYKEPASINITYDETRPTTEQDAEYGYRGIYTTASPNAPDSSYMKVGYQPGIAKIVAKWNGSVTVRPSCIDSIADNDVLSNAAGWTADIYKYTDYKVPDVDGDKVTTTGKQKVVSNVKVIDGDGDDGYSGYSTDASISDKGDYYRLNMRGGHCNWCLIEMTCTDNAYPIIGTLYGRKLFAVQTNWMSPHNGGYAGKRAHVRADSTYYYLTNYKNTNPTYVYVLKAWGGAYGNDVTNNGVVWQLSYANRHILSQNDDTNDDNVSSYEFSPISKNPYYVYSAAASLTAYSKADYTHKQLVTTVYVPNLANEFSIYNTYKKVEKAGKYSTIHYLVSCGAYPADHSQNSAYTNFKYLTLSTHDKKIRKYKNRRAYIYFSGAYNKLYELKKGYNVIYIPRGQISANSGDNDSATISATLNDVKIISIEWSNHLNGTEGCYTCSDSNGNDAKLSDGSTSAVYYQKLTRSKNARWNSLHGNFVGGDVPFTGHNSLKISTEINGWGEDPNDPDTSSIYLENKRTVRPRQYTAGEIKILNNTYDYPFYGGDFSIVFENVNRIPELYTWIDSLASTKHEYQFNYINGVGRYCHIWSALNPSYDPQTGFEREAFFVNAPIIGYIAKMCCIECTVDVNRMLMAAGYQTCNVQNTGDGMQSAGATDIMRRTISPKMIDAFNRAFGNNGRIYVIHYRYNKDGFSNWSPSSWKVYKNYTASNQSELKKVLSEILFDIQYFAEYQDAKIVN